MNDVEDACAVRKAERDYTIEDRERIERQERLVDLARQLCEYAAWIRTEMMNKQSGSL